MRSRYTAFATGSIEHLHETLAPGTRDDFDFDETKKWAESSEWLGLEIRDTRAGSEQDDFGEVEFIARYKQKAGAFEHRERGNFTKQDGQWYYVDGQIMGPETIRKAPKVGRNDPCPCGSGKKYKKCCSE